MQNQTDLYDKVADNAIDANKRGRTGIVEHRAPARLRQDLTDGTTAVLRRTPPEGKPVTHVGD